MSKFVLGILSAYWKWRWRNGLERIFSGTRPGFQPVTRQNILFQIMSFLRPFYQRTFFSYWRTWTHRTILWLNLTSSWVAVLVWWCWPGLPSALAALSCHFLLILSFLPVVSVQFSICYVGSSEKNSTLSSLCIFLHPHTSALGDHFIRKFLGWRILWPWKPCKC